MTRMKVAAFMILCITAVAPIEALAQTGRDIESQVTTQLRQQGFYNIQVEHTLLGRLRFLSTNGALDREIVVNARSGEVLRDYWAARSNNGSAGRQKSGADVVIADPTLPDTRSGGGNDGGAGTGSGGASGSASGSGQGAGAGPGAAADGGGPASVD